VPHIVKGCANRKVMGSDVWGPPLWQTMHFVALAYDEKTKADINTESDRDAYRVFFGSLKRVIPCETCARHYVQVLGETPIDTALAREDGGLFEWTVIVHNAVNTRLQKPKWTVEAARKHYADLIDGKKIDEDGSGDRDDSSPTSITSPPRWWRDPRSWSTAIMFATVVFFTVLFLLALVSLVSLARSR